MNRRIRLAAALTFAATVLLPRAHAAEVGAGAAQATLTCSGHEGAAAIALESPAFLYEGRVRSLTLTMSGTCLLLGGSFLYGQGEAQLTGDGISCGGDPDAPFIAAFLYDVNGFVGTDGPCMVDGVERTVQLGAHGVMNGDQFTGVLTPDHSPLTSV